MNREGLVPFALHLLVHPPQQYLYNLYRICTIVHLLWTVSHTCKKIRIKCHRSFQGKILSWAGNSYFGYCITHLDTCSMASKKKTNFISFGELMLKSSRYCSMVHLEYIGKITVAALSSQAVCTNLWENRSHFLHIHKFLINPVRLWGTHLEIVTKNYWTFFKLFRTNILQWMQHVWLCLISNNTLLLL